MWARRGWGYGYGQCGGGPFGGPFGGPDGGPHGYWDGGGYGWGRRGGRRGGWSRWLFERLETTPGQERAILDAFARLRSEAAPLRDEWRQTRDEVARAFEAGLIDDNTFEETFARHDRAQARMRVSLVETIKAVAEALDERQRKVLANLLTRGPFGRMGGWPGWRGSESFAI
jgi:Spy/CpxP family protein refolding chaperone